MSKQDFKLKMTVLSAADSRLKLTAVTSQEENSEGFKNDFENGKSLAELSEQKKTSLKQDFFELNKRFWGVSIPSVLA